MAKSQLNLIYALKNNQIIYVDDVENGAKCGCICPACSAPLIAKNQGTNKAHHFAHKGNQSCEYGYETSLHWEAKEILLRAKKIIIPSVHLKFHSYKDVLLSSEMETPIDKVELEVRFGSIVPDVVVYVGKRKFFIEIFVTHKIDSSKLDKLKEQGVSTLEIDLSKKERTISREELSDILLKSSEEKTWRYNAKAEEWRNRFYSVVDRRPIINRGLAVHVDDCPLAARRWRGKPYANVMDDCIYCKYCISYEKDILCSGRLRISDIEDFKIPLAKRTEKSNVIWDGIKKLSFIRGKCPNCGGDLIFKGGKYGGFWGCSNFPHCRFVASVNPETGELTTKL